MSGSRWVSIEKKKDENRAMNQMVRVEDGWGQKGKKRMKKGKPGATGGGGGCHVNEACGGWGPEARFHRRYYAFHKNRFEG